jgi:two-component system alkaline phosphatase synthesis response regulator PhoP
MPVALPVPSASGCKALVVDDEPHIVELVKACLEEEGYEVDGASTASQALDLIRKDTYDFMVLDIMLPDMDGIMAHERIRAIDPQLAAKTIFVSGWVKSPEIRDYLVSIGSFLPKPFSVDDLVRIAKGMSSDN